MRRSITAAFLSIALLQPNPAHAMVGRIPEELSFDDQVVDERPKAVIALTEYDRELRKKTQRRFMGAMTKEEKEKFDSLY